jgi:amino acid transporter
VCHLGGEIKNPAKNIPRSMFISITGITLLYLLMNISVASVIPWQQAQNNKHAVSLFFEQLMGPTAAAIGTALILWIAFSSLFSTTLGYSRIPYSAAADGNFLKIFARLHPTKNFPYVSLLALGIIAFGFSLVDKLELTIKAILAMRILTQFICQSAGLILLRRNRKKETEFPYKMPLFPLPVLLGIVCWFFLFLATGKTMITYALIAIISGLIVYFIKAKKYKE